MPEQKQTHAQRTELQAPTPIAEKTVGEPAAIPQQTHFWVSDDDLAVLDEWVYQLRRSGWRRVSRSACLRAMIEAARDLPLDLNGVSNETEFIDAVRQAFHSKT